MSEAMKPAGTWEKATTHVKANGRGWKRGLEPRFSLISNKMFAVYAFSNCINDK